MSVTSAGRFSESSVVTVGRVTGARVILGAGLVFEFNREEIVDESVRELATNPCDAIPFS
jgi:hypothetical protein